MRDGTAGRRLRCVAPADSAGALHLGLRRAGIVFPFIGPVHRAVGLERAFFTKVNLLDILDQQASTLIIAAAGTLVLVAGGIDLSVGAIYALAGVTAAQLALHLAAWLAIVAGIAVGPGGGPGQRRDRDVLQDQLADRDARHVVRGQRAGQPGHRRQPGHRLQPPGSATWPGRRSSR